MTNLKRCIMLFVLVFTMLLTASVASAASPTMCGYTPRYLMQVTVPGRTNPYAGVYYSARVCYNGVQLVGDPTITTSYTIYQASARYTSTSTQLIGSTSNSRTYRTTVLFSIKLSTTSSVWRSAVFEVTYYGNGTFTPRGYLN